MTTAAPLQTQVGRSAPTHNTTYAVLQRKCACGSPSQAHAQSRAATKQSTRAHDALSYPAGVPCIVREVLRSPGAPLEPATRSFMEERLGHDFGRVRLHTGATAAESARAVNALAYTVGQDIVVDETSFNVNSEHGAYLLAHELVHTIQQSSAPSAGRTSNAGLRISQANDSSELEADTVARKALSQSTASESVSQRGIPVLSRRSLVLARVVCSSLSYRSCRTGVYKCGYGGSGTCGWGKGGCICVGASKPPIKEVLRVLAIIGVSVLLVITVIAALLDPEPVTKLGLAGLSAAQIALLLSLLGYTEPEDAETAAVPDEGQEAGV